jgi:hypothetical protein
MPADTFWIPSKESLAANIRHLRRLLDYPVPRLATISELLRVAERLCPGRNGLDGIKASVQLAIVRLPQDDWPEVAELLYGLADASRDEPLAERRRLAFEKYCEVARDPDREYSQETFRTGHERKISEDLAAALIALVEESYKAVKDAPRFTYAPEPVSTHPPTSSAHEPHEPRSESETTDVAGQADEVGPAAIDDSGVEVEPPDSPAESESEEQISPSLPPSAEGGRDDVEDAATDADDTDGEWVGLVEPTDDAEPAELVKLPGSSGPRKPHPRLLAILATTVLILVGVTVTMLLILGSAGSARRRSAKNFPVIMRVEASSLVGPGFNYGIYNLNNNCDDPSNPALNYGRCGSMNGPVFDSFINTPYYGDERSFLQYPVATDIANGAPEITLRVYIDNDANPSTDCVPAHRDANGTCRQIDYEAIGIAHHTRIRITLPNQAKVSEILSVAISITAGEVPEVVRNSAEIEADREISVSYVPGSAIEYNNGPFKHGVQLPDSIVTPRGAPVGYSALERGFPGGFKYAATVVIRLAVHLH